MSQSFGPRSGLEPSVWSLFPPEASRFRAVGSRQGSGHRQFYLCTEPPRPLQDSIHAYRYRSVIGYNHSQEKIPYQIPKWVPKLQEAARQGTSCWLTAPPDGTFSKVMRSKQNLKPVRRTRSAMSTVHHAERARHMYISVSATTRRVVWPAVAVVFGGSRSGSAAHTPVNRLFF
jgi:hypothetical protein